MALRLSDADLAAIDSVRQSYVRAATTGSPADPTALHTEDGVRMPPNAPAVEVRAGIERALEEDPPSARWRRGPPPVAEIEAPARRGAKPV